MKVVLQRVARAQVRAAGEQIAAIGRGLLLLAAIERDDREADLEWCARKVVSARVFADDAGRMNLSVSQVGGAILAVSQFTLVGDLRRGRRPSFVTAAPPEQAEAAYGRFLELLSGHGVPIRSGRFRADMEVDLVNDGPVTLIVDSAQRLEARPE